MTFRGILLTALLMLSGALAQTTQQVPIQGRLDSNSTTISSGEYMNTHRFEARGGEAYALYLYSSDFDAYLGIMDPQGSAVGEVDDFLNLSSDAFLAARLPATGPHSAVVTSYAPNETGAYTLYTVTGLTPAGRYSGTLGPSSLKMHLSDTTVSADLYLVEARGGDSLAFTVNSSDFDAYLAVVGPDGSVEVNDDTEGLNPSLRFNAPQGGIYSVFVISLDNSGAYELQIGGEASALTPPATGSTSPATPPAPAAPTPAAPTEPSNPLTSPPVIPRNPLGSNPSAAPQDPFLGSFSDTQLTLELQGGSGSYTGQITFGGRTFPVNASSSGSSLAGSFSSDGNQFPFTATLSGDTLTFTTGGTSYILVKRP